MPEATPPPSRPGVLAALGRLLGALLYAAFGRALLAYTRRLPARPRREPRRAPRVAPPDRVPPLFPRRRATAWLLSLAAAAGLLAVGGLAFAMGWVRTPYVTGQFAYVEQPVPFSHKLHVTAFEIDCRYCHSSVTRSVEAGMPDSRSCLPCHNDTWLASAWFAPVRRSIETGLPIPWQRVYDLPDHVYFNHAIHVRRGMDCALCHGDVGQMDVVYQAAPLTMQWCVDCHQDPEPWLRLVQGSTVERETRPHWPAPPTVPESLAIAVSRLTTCTACHR